jgi:hypothetical protein
VYYQVIKRYQHPNTRELSQLIANFIDKEPTTKGFCGDIWRETSSGKAESEDCRFELSPVLSAQDHLVSFVAYTK